MTKQHKREQIKLKKHNPNKKLIYIALEALAKNYAQDKNPDKLCPKCGNPCINEDLCGNCAEQILSDLGTPDLAKKLHNNIKDHYDNIRDILIISSLGST